MPVIEIDIDTGEPEPEDNDGGFEIIHNPEPPRPEISEVPPPGLGLEIVLPTVPSRSYPGGLFPFGVVGEVNSDVRRLLS